MDADLVELFCGCVDSEGVGFIHSKIDIWLTVSNENGLKLKPIFTIDVDVVELLSESIVDRVWLYICLHPDDVDFVTSD